MKILVIGGLHGNEPLGVDIVRRLEVEPIEGVVGLVGNPRAVDADVRFTQDDLNRSFPGATDGSYEEQRAIEVLGACDGFDVVLDFHNTHTSGNDCGFVGDSTLPITAWTAAFLGLERVIVADYDCINKACPVALSVEISLGSGENDVELWLNRLATLASIDASYATEAARSSAASIDWYRFFGRVTQADADLIGRPDWDAFKPVKSAVLEPLFGDRQLPVRVVPIFIEDAYTPANYAALVVPSEAPAALVQAQDALV